MKFKDLLNIITDDTYINIILIKSGTPYVDSHGFKEISNFDNYLDYTVKKVNTIADEIHYETIGVLDITLHQ